MPYRHDERPAPRRRGLQECPWCHVQVLPSVERECPSCRRNVDEAVDDGLRSITVGDGVALPGVCARCGESTQRQVALRPSRHGEGVPLWLRVILIIWYPLLALFLRARKVQRIRVRLGLCGGCEPIVPEHVDFERNELTLLVHRRLHAAMLERDA